MSPVLSSACVSRRRLQWYRRCGYRGDRLVWKGYGCRDTAQFGVLDLDGGGKLGQDSSISPPIPVLLPSLHATQSRSPPARDLDFGRDAAPPRTTPRWPALIGSWCLFVHGYWLPVFPSPPAPASRLWLSKTSLIPLTHLTCRLLHALFALPETPLPLSWIGCFPSPS